MNCLKYIVWLVVVSLSPMAVGFSVIDRLVYKIDIYQGNIIDLDQVAKLKLGMNQEQVAFLLGSPLLKDPFNHNNWYYLQREQKGHQQPKQRQIKLYFTDNRLADIKKIIYADFVK